MLRGLSLEKKPDDGSPPGSLPLDPSGSAESDLHLSLFDDDRHLPATVGMREHLVESGRILFDIEVLDGDLSRCVVLTGRIGVGSGVPAEDQHLVVHSGAPFGDLREHG